MVSVATLFRPTSAQLKTNFFRKGSQGPIFFAYLVSILYIMRMKYISFLLFYLIFTLAAYAGKEIKIGCAYTCDSYTQESLKQSAKTLSLKLKLIDLSVQRKVDWNEIHGVVIPGGADINPKFYLQHVESDLQAHIKGLDHLVVYTTEGEKRDEFEYNLLRDYYSNPSLIDFPVLGLCRGMQIMTVALGIPLYVDIKTELQIDNRIDLYDHIQVSVPDSLMAKLFPIGIFPAYKYHHQGIRVPYYLQHRERWPNVLVSAFSNDDKIAEGLELLDRPALGVQFHPEADNNSIRKAVFDWFVRKARDRKHATPVNHAIF